MHVKTIILALFLPLFFAAALFADNADEQRASSRVSNVTNKPYIYTDSYFDDHIGNWTERLEPYKGKTNIHYLEIGLFEGRSFFWILDNILTHPTSRLTGIDIFTGELKERYLHNLSVSGAKDRVTTIIGPSQLELKKLPLNHYDIIYVDGSHRADTVLADIVLSWQLLKVGGILILDDYKWTKHNMPSELTPGLAIDSFISCYRNYLEVVDKRYQVFLRKLREAVCPDLGVYDDRCSTIGQSIYLWEKKMLYEPAEKKWIDITPKEQELIEQMLKAKSFGETNIPLSSLIKDRETFRSVVQKTKLNLREIEF